MTTKWPLKKIFFIIFMVFDEVIIDDSNNSFELIFPIYKAKLTQPDLSWPNLILPNLLT